MRKNIFLFLLLAGLLTFTYYYEEVGGINRREATRLSKTLFQDQNLGEIEIISFPFAKIIKRGDGYFTQAKNLPVDPDKLEQVLDIFAGIESISILNFDLAKIKRSHFFPNESYKFSFEFKAGKLTYLLGKKLDYSQDFYMEISSGREKRVVVARDTSAAIGIYDPKKIKRDAGKFERLKRVILLSEDAYYNLKPLRNFKGPAIKVTVENVRNKKFSLDLRKMNSSPPVLGRLKYDENAINSYLLWLQTFESERIHLNWKQSDLKDQLSSVEITPEKGKPTYLTLYSRWGKKKGYFLTITGEKGLYHLGANKIKQFYSNVQNFWLKQALPVKKGEEIVLSFKNGKKLTFKVTQGKPFKVEVKDIGQELSQKSFHQLVNFLMGQAKRVSTKDDVSYKWDNKLLRISLDDLALKVYQEKDELLLLSEKDQTVFHYKIGRDLPIGVKTSDYFNHE
ncbi:MAG: hypothetical protein DRQ88_08920 [Epsilonproteobacteria bacterium]|nr:MAG: hypothetical protein DRQ89_06505 [Campylobacterota bacterium]RLA65654.1 MAG: hypothetical protein DRQ88_08920 [Campylobacterota bacterium]